jgi:uncharacterized protein YrzB (UPF0473 family)
MAENKNNEILDENEEAEVVMLTDEEGNEHAFQLIGEAELKGTKYYAFVPVDVDADGEFFEYTILKSVIENGEEMLVSIDDDDEFDDAADYFDAFLNEEIDYDEE